MAEKETFKVELPEGLPKDIMAEKQMETCKEIRESIKEIRESILHRLVGRYPDIFAIEDTAEGLELALKEACREIHTLRKERCKKPSLPL